MPKDLDPKTDFPAPWTVKEPTDECVQVLDASGKVLAYIYHRPLNQTRSNNYMWRYLDHAGALRIARAMARLPELTGGKLEP